MAKAINDDICIQGSTLVVGVKFPAVDDIYTFKYLLENNAIIVKYYIINTLNKIDVTDALYIVDGMDDNTRAFTVDTSKLQEGVLMVEVTATIPAHNGLPQRVEIARDSTGIAIIK